MPTLDDLVNPSDWDNPSSGDPYDLVAIGGGTAGLVAAIGAARLGARAALVEGHRMGGDCLNTGCVPSKALIASARVAHIARNAETYGVHTGPVSVDFPAVMERMRSLRLHIAHHDSFERVRDEGVDTFRGMAHFTGRTTLDVAGTTIRFVRAVVATGGSAYIPPIPGLAESAPLTNESVFELQALPARLVVLGGGPIGCELAQTFARFGSQVTLVERESQLLPRMDRDAAHGLEEVLRSEGVEVRTGARVERFEAGMAWVDDESVPFDRVLVATGRRANVTSLQLDRAGVRFDERGIYTNTRLQTDNPRVYASGDVVRDAPMFTHAADEMSRRVLRNALFFGRKRRSDMVVPSAIYTEPGVAHVGPLPAEIQQRALDVVRYDFADIDRALLDGDDRGFIKLVLHGRRIVGATVFGAHAGELITPVTLAIEHGISALSVSQLVVPYPTRSDAFRRASQGWASGRMSPVVKTLLGAVIRLRRSL